MWKKEYKIITKNTIITICKRAKYMYCVLIGITMVLIWNKKQAKQKIEKALGIHVQRSRKYQMEEKALLVSGCYGLNFVSSKFSCWNPNPQYSACDYI